MKLRQAILIAAPLLGVVSFLTYRQLQPAEDVTQGTSLVTVSPSESGIKIERGTAANAVDLVALKEEVTSLRAEVLALRQQMPRQLAAVPAAADGQPAADVHSDAEAARERQAEIEATDAAFRKQSIDPTWSANTVSTIRQVLANEEVGGIQADNIDCRSSSCRIELHDDGSGRLAKSLPVFAQQLGGTMPNLTADNIPNGNGSSTMVLYMSRDEGDEDSSR
jgi:hypothetical protein